MQECLRTHRPVLNWGCQEQLFRQEVENADDLRLSTRLFKACLADKKKVRSSCCSPAQALDQQLCGHGCCASMGVMSTCQPALCHGASWQRAASLACWSRPSSAGHG